MLGNSSVGKTALCYKYINNEFIENYKATIGADIFVKEIIVDDKYVVTIQLWDTAGQERYSGDITKQLCRGSNAVIFVYDATNENSLNQIDKWRKKHYEYSGMHKHEITTFPYLLLANKIDLIQYPYNHYNPQLNINGDSELLISGYCRDNDFNFIIPLEIIHIILRYYMNLIDRGREYAKRYNMLFYEVSALNGMNIETAIYDLMKKSVYYARPWTWYATCEHCDPDFIGYGIERIEVDTNAIQSNVKQSYCCGLY